jgi:hypothetical protein
MSKTETLAFIGIGLTIVSLMRTQQAPAAPSQRPQTQKWAGAGTDPFGASYTVTARAQRSGL